MIDWFDRFDSISAGCSFCSGRRSTTHHDVPAEAQQGVEVVQGLERGLVQVAVQAGRVKKRGRSAQEHSIQCGACERECKEPLDQSTRTRTLQGAACFVVRRAPLPCKPRRTRRNVLEVLWVQSSFTSARSIRCPCAAPVLCSPQDGKGARVVRQNVVFAAFGPDGTAVRCFLPADSRGTRVERLKRARQGLVEEAFHEARAVCETHGRRRPPHQPDAVRLTACTASSR